MELNMVEKGLKVLHSGAVVKIAVWLVIKQ